MNSTEFLNRIIAVKDKLFRFALRLTGRQADAEDVVQEVMLRVWDKREERERIGNLEGFCMQIARNLSIDGLRRKDNQHKDLEGIPERETAHAESPQAIVEYEDLLKQVRRIIEDLPVNQKMVLQLRDVEEMSYQDIADALEMPMQQVKVNLFRARTYLKEQLLATQYYGLQQPNR